MYGLAVGGGGGVGGASISTASAVGGLSITLGADGSSGGLGGSALLNNDGQITTSGNDAYGMFAQTIGGGGGFVAVTGQEIDQSTGISQSVTEVLRYAGQIQLSNPASGSNGGNAEINLYSDGKITTSGINSYGIHAQSVGGSGGVFIINPNPTPDFCSLYQACDNQRVNRNDGGTVTVNSQSGSSITTAGAGAAGIFAQAIGGGGVNINGLNGVDLLNASHDGPPGRGNSESDYNAGFAGNVNIHSNGNITTTGAYAHGILAQVASNGGGVLGRADGTGYLFSGLERDNVSVRPCTTEPCLGHASVVVGDDTSPSTISVSGAHAFGVAAISVGSISGMNRVDIVVNKNASIIATGQAAGAVLIVGQDTANLINAGTIDGSKSARGIAIATLNSRPFAFTNSGYVGGSIGNTGSISGPVAPQAGHPRSCAGTDYLRQSCGRCF